MEDIRLEVIESTVYNIKKEIIRMKKNNIKYGELERLDYLLDELAENTVKYNRILTNIMGFKYDKKSTKTKEVIKLSLIDKYNSGEIN